VTPGVTSPRVAVGSSRHRVRRRLTRTGAYRTSANAAGIRFLPGSSTLHVL
jgi:hypothetical protein